MKVKFIITAVILITCIIVGHAAITETTIVQQQTSNQTTDSQWVEVGEVTLFRYDVRLREWKRRQGANLFAYCIGERMLYKVQFNAKMYSVSTFNTDENLYETYKSFNAKVTIDGQYWYLNVPGW